MSCGRASNFIQRIICISLFFLLPSSSFSQQESIRFDHITIEQGLSDNTPLVLVQDSKGFLWIGTLDGLNKYDGYTFKSYKNSLIDSMSIGDNFIFAIFEDSKKNLWVGSINGGLSRYIENKDQFRNYRHNNNDEFSISSNRVHAIFEDKSGTLWVGTENGLNRFNLESEQFTKIRFEHNEENRADFENIKVIIEDDTDTVLWIGTGKGLIRYNYRSGDYRVYRHNLEDSNTLSDDHIRSLLQDSFGDFWIGTYYGGLNKYHRAGDRFTRVGVPDASRVPEVGQRIYALHEDADKVLWIGTSENGLVRYNRDSNTFTKYLHDERNPHSLRGNSVLSILEDHTGILWLGLDRNGLEKYDSDKSAISLLRFQGEKRQNNSGGRVYAMTNSRSGNIFVGTSDGLGIIDTNVPVLSYVFSEDRHGDFRIRSLYEDANQDLWIGMYDLGLGKYRKDIDKFFMFPYESTGPASLNARRAESVYRDSKGKLWIGTYGGGLAEFDEIRKEFKRYTFDRNDPHSISGNNVSKIYEDSGGNLWIGTFLSGLNKFERDNNRFIRYVHDSRSNESISNNQIHDILEDQDGKIWVGTGSGGLNKFNEESDTFTRHLDKSGFLNDRIYNIHEGRDGILWLGTNKKLLRYDTKTLDLIGYSTQYFFNENAFIDNNTIVENDGIIYTGGTKGVSYFTPDALGGDDEVLPKIAITSVLIDNEPLEMMSQSKSSGTEKLILPYGNNHIEFTFAVMDFRIPAENQFAYMLEGLEDEWINSGTRNSAYYPHLEPGEYTFKVKGANHAGMWNETGETIKISIYPPFWMTGWFQLLSILMTVTALVTAHKLRTLRLKRQKKVLSDEVQRQTEDLREKQDQLVKARVELEVRVASRTKELEKANLELSNEINERKQIEEALRQNEEKFRQVTENIKEVFWLRTDKEVLYISPEYEKIFGRSCKSLYENPRSFLDAIHKDDIDGFKNKMRGKFSESGDIEDEIRIVRPDGGIRWLNVKGFPVLDENGKTYRHAGVALDVTASKQAEKEKKKLEEQLLHAQKMESIGRLAGGVAHDFNNILQIIIGQTQNLKLDLSDGGYHDSIATDNILSAVHKAAKLNRELLGFARKGKHNPVALNINKVIADILNMSEKIFAKNVNIKYNFQPGIKTIEADKNQIEQVITNLIINANDAMPGGGDLLISTENLRLSGEQTQSIAGISAGKYVKISVTDSGAGMDQETKDRIFEPFFTTKEEGKGTGLGLATVYGIVKNHGGHITVDSTLHKGTTFDIYLPASDIELIEEKKTAEHFTTRGEGNILLADDEEQLRKLAEVTLTKFGFTVTTAKDGTDAIEQYKKNADNIDAVVLDIAMPEKSGEEVFYELRAFDPEVKVIIVSGYSKNKTVSEMLKNGACAFVEKPYNLFDFVKLVNDVVQK